jgi:hypothetical protein
MTSQPKMQGRPELSIGERILRDQTKRVRKMRWIGAGCESMSQRELLGGTEAGRRGPARECGARDARLPKAALMLT